MTGKVQFLEGPKQGVFKKYCFLMISDMTSQSHILQMTAFLRCFWKCLPNRFCLNMEPHDLVWKSVTAILHRISVSIFKIVFKSEIYGTKFPDFSYSRPKQVCLCARWRVDMSKNLPIYFEIWKCWTNYLWSRTKVDRIYLAVNMAVSLFQNEMKIPVVGQNMQIKQVFVLYCLYIWPWGDNTILMYILMETLLAVLI